MDKIDYRQEIIKKIEVPVSQLEVKAGSVNTAYLSAGEGETVICLHGGGGGAVAWYPTISVLAEKYHVVVPDLVGYGETDKPNASYDRPYYSGWLKSFMLALGISKTHIVGLSLGGAITLQFTLDNPEMVNKLVLVDSGALGARPSIGSFVAMWWLNAFPSELANKFMLRYLLANPKNGNANYSNYSLQVLNKPGGKKAFIQGKGAAMSAIPEENLKNIKNQTLVIWGRNDNLFSFTYGESAADKIPNAKLHIIENAGHLPMIDQPEIFNKSLLNFLGQ